MPWWRKQSAEQRLPIISAAGAEHEPHPQQDGKLGVKKSPSIFILAKSLWFARRRLRFDPDKKLYFFYEPGKQVSSAVSITNTSHSPVAFKFQTNSPKSCFMRPANGILTPGETVISTIVKFVEQPEQNQEKKSKDKFKIFSLKVKTGIQFTRQLFDEQKEFVVVERVLRVVFLDPESSSPDAEKLKKRLAQAEAAQQARKKPQEDKAQKTTTTTTGAVLDEWKEQQREKELVKQETECVVE